MCRCMMCGVKQAGKVNRGLYVRYGVTTDEHFNKFAKENGRKLLRRRLKNELRQFTY